MDVMGRSSIINEVAFEAIPTEDVRAAYTNIEADLRTVMRKSYSDWIPADVYASCLLYTSPSPRDRG